MTPPTIAVTAGEQAAQRATPPTPSAAPLRSAGKRGGGEPILDPEPKGRLEQVALFLFVTVPFLALLAAVPVAWGWGLGWRDIVITLVGYVVTGLGVTVGFHRYFTHSSFKANRAVKTALGVAGSLAIEGPVVRWVADHRRHHSFSDKDGDPHSPWRYGDSVPALAKGLWYAHTGWMFDAERTNVRKYAPDLLKDPQVQRLSRAFPALVAVSLLLPPLVGGLLSWSWQGALTAFFWGSLVRICLLHHVTWSVNSICHVLGERPFNSRDKSGNVWWLAPFSLGESWHNLHHADPTSARHGVLKGQVDISARVIWVLERLGWVTDVRWPKPERIAARRA